MQSGQRELFYFTLPGQTRGHKKARLLVEADNSDDIVSGLHREADELSPIRGGDKNCKHLLNTN